MTSTLQEEKKSPTVVSEENDRASCSPSPYRFIRCNPRFVESESIAELTAEVNRKPFPLAVPWLEGYYAIPSSFSLHKSKLFQSSRVYGQDVSSGAAVAALLSSLHDFDSSQHGTDTSSEETKSSLRILDLCCCPGLKLCAVADWLYQKQISGDLIGVDISESRMAVCKRILRKYQIQPLANSTICVRDDAGTGDVRVKLFCNDGTNVGTTNRSDLNLVFDSTVSYDDELSRLGKRKRMNKSARARETKRLREATSFVESLEGPNSKLALFDRVLVDAECSTDGSIVHVHKRLLKNQDAKSSDKSLVDGARDSLCVFADDELVKLCELQRDLASSGYQLLRKGGIMVYSTCSLLECQNGAVVQWLLNKYPDARLVPLNFFQQSHAFGPIDFSDLVQQGSIPGTIQFFPNLDEISFSSQNKRLFGGGFYVAKITKI